MRRRLVQHGTVPLLRRTNPQPASKDTLSLMSMNLSLARVSLILSACAFCGFGLWLLIHPEALSLLDLQLDGPAARIEVRGYYGGLGLGMAAFFAVCATREPWFSAGLLAQGLSLGGAALVRVLAMSLEGTTTVLLLVLTSLEATGSIIGFAALARRRSVRVHASRSSR